jgi:hypothetical protein
MGLLLQLSTSEKVNPESRYSKAKSRFKVNLCPACFHCVIEKPCVMHRPQQDWFRFKVYYPTSLPHGPGRRGLWLATRPVIFLKSGRLAFCKKAEGTKGVASRLFFSCFARLFSLFHQKFQFYWRISIKTVGYINNSSHSAEMDCSTKFLSAIFYFVLLLHFGKLCGLSSLKSCLQIPKPTIYWSYINCFFRWFPWMLCMHHTKWEYRKMPQNNQNLWTWGRLLFNHNCLGK